MQTRLNDRRQASGWASRLSSTLEERVRLLSELGIVLTRSGLQLTRLRKTRAEAAPCSVAIPRWRPDAPRRSRLEPRLAMTPKEGGALALFRPSSRFEPGRCQDHRHQGQGAFSHPCPPSHLAPSTRHFRCGHDLSLSARAHPMHGAAWSVAILCLSPALRVPSHLSLSSSSTGEHLAASTRYE